MSSEAGYPETSRVPGDSGDHDALSASDRRRSGRREVSAELLPLLRSPAQMATAGTVPQMTPAIRQVRHRDDDHGPGFIPALALAIVLGTMIWALLIWAGLSLWG